MRTRCRPRKNYSPTNDQASFFGVPSYRLSIMSLVLRYGRELQHAALSAAIPSFPAFSMTSMTTLNTIQRLPFRSVTFTDEFIILPTRYSSMINDRWFSFSLCGLLRFFLHCTPMINRFMSVFF